MTASSYFKFSAAWPEGSEDVAKISLRVGEKSSQELRIPKSRRYGTTSEPLLLAWRFGWQTIGGVCAGRRSGISGSPRWTGACAMS